jgi:hypothetical protein
MSKLTEIQNQYQGYVAASEAVKKTDPGNVEVVYKERGNPSYNGIFIYYPQEDKIEILPERWRTGSGISLGVNEAFALIKALREFFE